MQLTQETFFTFTLGNLITILTGLASLVWVYIDINNRVIKLFVNADNNRAELVERKKEITDLETKVEAKNEKLMSMETNLTLALQGNTLAIQELRNFMQKLESRFEKVIEK